MCSEVNSSECDKQFKNGNHIKLHEEEVHVCCEIDYKVHVCSEVNSSECEKWFKKIPTLPQNLVR